jgi:two-component system, cell cycle response regulator DivK
MSQRILVVEDQEDNRRILRDLLTSADFEVIEAEDGEAGLAAAAAQKPDLILMDVQLPGIDGYEATRRLKRDAMLRDVPVIAVTAHALSGAEQEARAREAQLSAVAINQAFDRSRALIRARERNTILGGRR